MITRRLALLGMFAAPAIVRASSLMAVVPVPAANILNTVGAGIAGDGLALTSMTYPVLLSTSPACWFFREGSLFTCDWEAGVWRVDRVTTADAA